MINVIEANWLAFALALIIGLLVAWWLFGRASTAPRRGYKPDVLDEGTAPAQRNQALIDAPPAAAPIITPPPMSGAMGGIGELIAVGAQDVVEEAAAAAPISAALDDLADPGHPHRHWRRRDDRGRRRCIDQCLIARRGGRACIQNIRFMLALGRG